RHLGAPEIVDQGVPVTVKAEPRVLVLVEGGAIEVDEAMGVRWKVRRHPVQDDADAGSVQPVDEPGEVVGGAETAGRGEKADRLVTPGAGKRVLRYRHQHDMGEVELGQIGDE